MERIDISNETEETQYIRAVYSCTSCNPLMKWQNRCLCNQTYPKNIQLPKEKKGFCVSDGEDVIWKLED